MSNLTNAVGSTTAAGQAMLDEWLQEYLVPLLIDTSKESDTELEEVAPTIN